MRSFQKHLVISVISLFAVCLFCKVVKANDLNETYSNFFRQIEKVKEWEELAVLRNGYRVDDGIFAELYSEKVEWLFKNRYQEFFSKVVYKDSEYFAFIKLHVNDTWTYGSEGTLLWRLEESCPKSHEALCQKG